MTKIVVQNCMVSSDWTTNAADTFAALPVTVAFILTLNRLIVVLITFSMRLSDGYRIQYLDTCRWKSRMRRNFTSSSFATGLSSKLNPSLINGSICERRPQTGFSSFYHLSQVGFQQLKMLKQIFNNQN